MSKLSQSEWEQWFLEVWQYREDVVYRRLFGDIGTTIHTIPALLFQRMGEAEIDPRWTTHGVFECPPHGERKHYAYVTSALSNPWGIDPTTAKEGDPSGLGFEILLETSQKAPWAISTLHWLMAIQLLAASGRLQGETIFAGARVPLYTSINPQNPNSLIRNLLITEPTSYPNQIQLASGYFNLLQCVGLTDGEMTFCRDYHNETLIALLGRETDFPIIDDLRSEVELAPQESTRVQPTRGNA